MFVVYICSGKGMHNLGPEFKGGLHASCLRPWSFQERFLEMKFQEYNSASALDRSKFAMTAVCYALLPVRLTFMTLRFVYSSDWTRQELAFMLGRLWMQTCFIVGLTIHWSGQYKILITKLLTWVPRIGCCIYMYGEGAQQDESTILLLPITATCFLGALLPSFLEFVGWASLVFMLKPFYILLMGSNGCPRGTPSPCPGRDFPTVLVQNSGLLLIIIGVFYHFFSDTRRHWLLSFEVFGPLNELGPSSASQIPTAGSGRILRDRMDENGMGLTTTAPANLNAQVDGAVELDHDTYFPPEGRTAQLETWRQERAAIAARMEEAPVQGWRRAHGKLGGRVYKAVDTETGDRLALKILPGGVAHGAFFLREARRARALAHPSLAAVRGGEVRGGALCLLVEYCGGGSVQALLRGAGAPLAAEVAREMGRQAAAGLAYLHRHRVRPTAVLNSGKCRKADHTEQHVM